jgi:hypothetical protein
MAFQYDYVVKSCCLAAKGSISVLAIATAGRPGMVCRYVIYWNPRPTLRLRRIQPAVGMQHSAVHRSPIERTTQFIVARNSFSQFMMFS